MKPLKTVDQQLTVELMESLIKKFIHVPTNMFKKPNDLDGGQEDFNAWFGGCVAGYEVAKVWYDMVEDKFLDEPRIFHSLLLADGMSYNLSPDELVINEITEEEFTKMVAEQQAKLAIQNSILMPGKDF